MAMNQEYMDYLRNPKIDYQTSPDRRKKLERIGVDVDAMDLRRREQEIDRYVSLTSEQKRKIEKEVFLRRIKKDHSYYGEIILN